MADSEGTWQIGADNAATMAATDFGQWSPTDGDPDEDLWAQADAKLRPVSLRALKRGVLQAAELGSGERAFDYGVLLDGDQLLTAEGGAAEVALDDVRIRRPIQIRCAYDGGVTVTKLYPSLAAGVGSDAASGIDEAVIVSTVAVRLKTIAFACDASLGSTTIEVEANGSPVDSCTTTIGAGITTVDFLTLAGAHTISAGAGVSISIDPTTAHDKVRLLLEFEEVPA